MLSVLLPLLLLLNVAASSHRIDAMYLQTAKDAQMGNFYLCTMYIGSPKERVRLVATFSHGHILLNPQLLNLLYTSSTWLSDGGPDQSGFDEVMISGDIFRWPIKYSADVSYCDGLCVGEIGFGPTSNIWSLWSNAYFFSRYIRLGVGKPNTKNKELESFSFNRAVQSEVFLKSNTESGVVSVRFVGNGRTKVPQRLYDDILYKNEELLIPKIEYSASFNSVFSETYRGVAEIRIEPTEDERVELGSVLFKDYSIFVDRYNDNVVLYLATGDSSGRVILPWHSVTVMLLIFVILYYKMVDLALLYDYNKKMEFFLSNKELTADQHSYIFTKVGHSLILTFEIILVPIAFFVNGIPSYTTAVDIFLTVTLCLSWSIMFLTGLFTLINLLWLKNYDPLLLEFSTWLRSSSEIAPLVTIIVLQLDGTNIDVGMGIIITLFDFILLYTMFRTVLSFIILTVTIPNARVFFHISAAAIWAGVSLWISWEYFFNSYLLFVSEALSVNINLITVCVVLLIGVLVSYFHRLFLLANICNRLTEENKLKSH